jgi:putative endonuclease
MYVIYFLISKENNKTYVGFSNRLEGRIREHQEGKVKTTRDFGDFNYFVLERVEMPEEARRRERYWKSATGRKKLQRLYSIIKKH